MIRKLLLLALLLPAALHASEPNDPWMLIDKAGQAAHALNFKGVFVYQAGNTVNSMQIMHMNYGPAGEFVRVVQLDGSPREVLRQGNDTVTYQPKREGKVMIDKRRLQNGFPAVLPRISEDIRANYVPRLGAVERVGGRDAQLLTLEPHDRYRYRCKMWMDRESGLLLKMAFLNEKDEIAEQVSFSQLLLVGDTPMDWFHPEVQRGKSYVINPEEKVTPANAQDESWQLGQIPPGFRKTEQVQRAVPGKSYPINHLVFWDGLASVSLFIEQVAQSATPRVGGYNQGATNVLVSINNGHQLVVLGEVPPATLTQFFNAVIFKK